MSEQVTPHEITELFSVYGDEIDLHIVKKVLYHGSATSGITQFNHAEEDHFVPSGCSIPS